MAYPGQRRPIGLWVFLGIGGALTSLLLVYLVLRTAPGTAFGPGFGGFGGLFLVFFVLWIIFFGVRIAFWSRRASYGRMGGGPPMRDPAILIARQRYARGEITREQFEQIMADLHRRGAQPPLP